MKTETVVKLVVAGGVALGLYLLWKKFAQPIANAASAGAQALTNTGEAIGSNLFDFFNPYTSYAGDDVFYTIAFPDGQKHAIGSSKVDANGRFSYGGQNWVIKQDAQGYKYAVAG